MPSDLQAAWEEWERQCLLRTQPNGKVNPTTSRTLPLPETAANLDRAIQAEATKLGISPITLRTIIVRLRRDRHYTLAQAIERVTHGK